ncbi:MAG: Hsp20/alpha crystallin family protein [Bacillota bacterium]
MRNRNRNCSLINYDLLSPNSLLDSFDDAVKRFMNDFYSNKDQFTDMFKNQCRYPKTDIYEKDGNLVFDLAVPGVEKNDIEVNVESGMLTISYQKEEKKEDKNMIVQELKHSSWSRYFKIPEKYYDVSKINAVMNNGILSISMPIINQKEEETKNKKLIEIK